MRVFSAAALLLVIIEAALLWLMAPSQVEVFLQRALAEGWTSDRLEPEVTEILSALVAEGEFKAGIVVNGPLRGGAVNVYLIDFDSKEIDGRSAKFKNTIAYLGNPNAILIDEAYVNSLGERLGFLADAEAIPNPYERAELNRSGLRHLLTWVLGHELGHMVGGHGNAHMVPSALDNLANYSQLGYAREIEADEQFAARLTLASTRQPDGVSTLLDFGSTMAAIFDAELSRVLGVPTKEGPLIFFTDSDSSPLLVLGSHPDFFLRTVRILSRLEFPNSYLRVFRENVQRFESRLKILPAAVGRVRVEGRPLSALIAVHGGRAPLPEYRVPADIWLSPGDYRITVRAEGYETMSRAITVKIGGATRVHTNLVPIVSSGEKDAIPVKAWREALGHVERAENFYLNKLEPDAARWELSRAGQIAPDWSVPTFLLAQLSEELNDLPQATALYERALDLRKWEPPGRHWNRDTLYSLSDAYDTYKKGDPKHEDHIDRLVALLDAIRFTGDTALANPFLTEAQTLAASDFRVWLRTAWIRRDERRVRDAEAAVRKSMKVEAPAAVDYSTLADIYEQQGLWRQAEQEAKKAAEADPGEVTWLVELAELYQRQREWSASARTFRRAMRLAPSEMGLTCQLGDVYLAWGRLDQADRAYRAASDHERCLLGLATTTRVAGRGTDARQICRRLTSEPTLSECVGDATLAMAQPTEASRAYRTALWFQPLSAALHRKLATAEAAAGAGDRAALHRSIADRLDPLVERLVVH